MTTIAVVVATYNGERWIDDQLRSILEQSRPADDVVVTDDASTDATLEIVGDRARVVRGDERTGVQGNLERGLATVTADVIVLADQDDMWAPTKLAAVEAWAATAVTGGWFSDGRVVDADGRPTGTGLWERAGFTGRLQRRWDTDPLAVLLRRPVVTGATLAFRREHLPRLLPFPAEGWHDYSISVLLAATAGITKDPRKLVDYRLHDENAAGLPPISHLDRIQDRDTHHASLHRQAAHFGQLAERLAAVPGTDADVGRLRAKQALLLRRAGLPRPRVLRFPGVLRALVSGGYHRYSQGDWIAARDLLWR